MSEDRLIEKFGAVIDEFLEENEIVMQIKMPENSMIPEVRDNSGFGAVVQFYIVTKALKEILKEMTENLGEIDKRPMLEEICKVLVNEVMEGEEIAD